MNNGRALRSRNIIASAVPTRRRRRRARAVPLPQPQAINPNEGSGIPNASRDSSPLSSPPLSRASPAPLSAELQDVFETLIDQSQLEVVPGDEEAPYSTPGWLLLFVEQRLRLVSLANAALAPRPLPEPPLAPSSPPSSSLATPAALLSARFSQQLAILQRVNAPTAGYGKAYIYITRYRMLDNVARAVGLDLHKPNKEVRANGVRLTYESLFEWAGFSKSTFGNHKVLVGLSLETYTRLSAMSSPTPAQIVLRDNLVRLVQDPAPGVPHPVCAEWTLVKLQQELASAAVIPAPEA
ncbi:hypothetical protein C8F01DRAFT_1362414 [Mycena amicta]|nr:hypothetical protein C8F01DRAFT_1362414 [Mycena amicta]